MTPSQSAHCDPTLFQDPRLTWFVLAPKSFGEGTLATCTVYGLYPRTYRLYTTSTSLKTPVSHTTSITNITKPSRGAHNNVSAIHHAQCCMQTEEAPHWHRAHSTKDQCRINRDPTTLQIQPPGPCLHLDSQFEVSC